MFYGVLGIVNKNNIKTLPNIFQIFWKKSPNNRFAKKVVFMGGFCKKADFKNNP